MDETTTMQDTEQKVQTTAAETQGQQTAESTPVKVSALQKFINGLLGGGKAADGAEPEKKEDKVATEGTAEEKSFTQADVDAAIEAAKQKWLDEDFNPHSRTGSDGFDNSHIFALHISIHTPTQGVTYLLLLIALYA